MLSITYLSSASHLLAEPELAGLMHQSRPNNQRDGITGMLLYHDGNIIQVLEGPDDGVARTFSRISDDPRHRGIIVTLREQIQSRAFPRWSMGYKRLTASEVSMPGYSEFLRSPISSDLADSSALAFQLLRSFRSGIR